MSKSKSKDEILNMLSELEQLGVLEYPDVPDIHPRQSCFHVSHENLPEDVIDRGHGQVVAPYAGTNKTVDIKADYSKRLCTINLEVIGEVE